MSKLTYKSSTGATVDLDGTITYVGSALGIRGRSWDYSLGYRDAYSLTRPAREAEVEAWTTPAEADRMRRVFDADVANDSPGELVVGGTWHQRALIVGMTPKVFFAGNVAQQLKVILLDGAWWSLEMRSFDTSSGSGTGLDYSFDYEFDYSSNAQTGSIETSLLVSAPVRIIIYGAATNPYVVVGSNRYEVDVEVPDGGYLVVDGREKTIRLVAQDGTVTNAFAYGVRGTGEGGGSYIFEPLPTGELSVSWDNSFGFDLGWYDEEGEPPWSLS